MTRFVLSHSARVGGALVALVDAILATSLIVCLVKIVGDFWGF